MISSTLLTSSFIFCRPALWWPRKYEVGIEAGGVKCGRGTKPALFPVGAAGAVGAASAAGATGAAGTAGAGGAGAGGAGGGAVRAVGVRAEEAEVAERAEGPGGAGGGVSQVAAEDTRRTSDCACPPWPRRETASRTRCAAAMRIGGYATAALLASWPTAASELVTGRSRLSSKETSDCSACQPRDGWLQLPTEGVEINSPIRQSDPTNCNVQRGSQPRDNLSSPIKSRSFASV